MCDGVRHTRPSPDIPSWRWSGGQNPGAPWRAPAVVAAAFVVYFVSIPGGFPAVTRASPAPSGPNVLTRGLNEIHDASGFSGAVVVVKDGRIIFRWASGKRDRSTVAPVTPDTRFRINGLTETLNWIALLRLRDAGKVDFDASVCRYFAPCPKSWRVVHVRDLMGLSSGLRPVDRAELSSAPVTPSAYIDRLRTKPLGFTPGTIIASNATRFYSGSSPAVMAARLLEIVSRQRWEAALRRLVFAPAGMSSTGLSRSGRTAKGYGVGAGGRFNERPLPQPLLDPDVEGGLWSTPADFARLDIAINSGTFLSMSSTRELNTPIYARDRRRGVGYSCCWLVGQTFGRASQITGGHGSGDGFYTVVERYPRDAVAVFAFSNVGASGPAFTAADFVSSVMLGAFPRVVPEPIQALRRLEGVYTNARYGLRIRVELDGDTLRVTEANHVMRNLLGPLIPIGDRTFVAGFSTRQRLQFSTSDPPTRVRYTALVGAHREVADLMRSS